MVPSCKALSEQFQHGATTKQLVNFFKDAWGRDIERTNLSPRLFPALALSEDYAKVLKRVPQSTNDVIT